MDVTAHEAAGAVALSQARLSEIRRLLDRLRKNIKTIMQGKDEIVEMAILTLCARGHLLIEDVPGVGKTTLARTLAQSVDCVFRRIQFTSDLLPSDVIGVSVFNSDTQEFKFKTGPIFSNIVLADEINRATPKTQSALLEAMSERQVTYDKATFILPQPFLVIATQNPFEHHGTFPLPESQLDRFFMRLHMGYPPADDEKAIIRSQEPSGLADDVEPVLSQGDIKMIQDEVSGVAVDDALVDYIIRVVRATRDSRKARLGASTRAAKVLYRAAQASALLSNRHYCLPDDIKRVAVAVLAHRVIPSGAISGNGHDRDPAETLINGILETLRVPI